MQKRNSIINIPLVGGIVLSIALHAAALYSRGIYTPAELKQNAGQTVVQLTLIPSISSQPAPVEPIVEPVQKPQMKPEPVVIPVAPVPIPVPHPTPEPIIEKNVASIPEPEPEIEPRPEPVESKEQIGTIIEDKGVISDAQPSRQINPAYPRSSHKRGHQGTVVLSIQVLENGKAGQVTVLSSSEFKRLDEAAVKAAQAADYIPRKQFGRNVESKLIQPFTFELTQ